MDSFVFIILVIGAFYGLIVFEVWSDSREIRKAENEFLHHIH